MITKPLSLEAAWSEFSDRLLRFVVSRGIDQNDAHDILQDLFIRYAQNKDKIKNPSGWLFRVLKNQVYDFYRKSTTGLELEQTEITADVDRRSFSQCLYPLIQKLPGPDRQVLISQLDGSSLKEITQKTGLSYPAIKARALRARDKLRRQFIACCQVRSFSNLQEACSDC